MKKIIRFILAFVLLLVLVGCGDSEALPIEKIYSFSGEIDEMRVVNGVAAIGGDSGAFYGGMLELKTDEFNAANRIAVKFYVSDGSKNWTILNSATAYKTDAFPLRNQENGQISGQIFTAAMNDKKAFEENLYFELEITTESGDTKVYIIPMEVKEVVTHEIKQ